jgi:broad specificity phosphatase PhoE
MGLLIMLRHGQASLGTANYDELSPLGVHQAGLAAARLTGADQAIDRVVCGGLLRQQDTAAAVLEALGRPRDAFEVDGRLDEYDHIGVLAAHTSSVSFHGVSGAAANRDLQPALEEAIARWALAESGYAEKHGEFIDRVLAVLAELTATPGTTLAVTSGGVIAVAAAHALGLPADGWPALARMQVNAGITKFITGRSGTNLLTLNDHAHLEAERALVTYR